jgi:hypothetical protein
MDSGQPITATVPAAPARSRTRRVVVAGDLADLRGPTEGAVELPLRLYWSGPSPEFDLGDADMRRWLYQIVLREAARPEDLASYLDRDTLIALWPGLFLPRPVRRAWEERHPVLRSAAAAA